MAWETTGTDGHWTYRKGPGGLRSATFAPTYDTRPDEPIEGTWTVPQRILRSSATIALSGGGAYLDFTGSASAKLQIWEQVPVNADDLWTVRIGTPALRDASGGTGTDLPGTAGVTGGGTGAHIAVLDPLAAWAGTSAGGASAIDLEGSTLAAAGGMGGWTRGGFGSPIPPPYIPQAPDDIWPVHPAGTPLPGGSWDGESTPYGEASGAGGGGWGGGTVGGPSGLDPADGHPGTPGTNGGSLAPPEGDDPSPEWPDEADGWLTGTGGSAESSYAGRFVVIWAEPTGGWAIGHSF